MVLQVILLIPYLPEFYKSKKHFLYFNKRERLYLFFIAVGYLLLPLIYVFSTWFSWFDYNIKRLLAIPALLLYIFGYWLFFKAYSELGGSWTPGFRVKEDHLLVTTGPYKWVRHPIYASFGVIAVAQIFLLQNWLVGPAFLILAIPFYHYRVRREEQQLVNYFGDDYRIYRRQTNAMVPKMEQLDYKMIVSKVKNRIKKVKFKKPI